MRLSMLGAALACGDGGKERVRIADVTADAAARANEGAVDETSLARATGGGAYTVSDAATPGVIVGRVTGATARDTMITPTKDVEVCSPFSESVVASTNGGVGNVAVWLVGVASGPRDDAPRRAKLTLNGCRLDPRMQRVALGGTLLVNGRDAMMSRLQFTAVGAGETTRATLLFSDVGQVVPTSTAAATPALVRVSDDLHPWVRAWLIVSPHPFAAVTAADGTFRFDHVPPGKYQLVIWHEHLGVQRTAVRVEPNVQTNVEMAY
ncbi:carboxypeptidase-like regulatory domain-containing protein [Gemmatimonas sp.]|uniref:carboxypeptidase-like regulatory domain-containing protein n=1 Tax=Gemmatimonas sp. TaxID=1962908 RepID=UPI002ED93A91